MGAIEYADAKRVSEPRKVTLNGKAADLKGSAKMIALELRNRKLKRKIEALENARNR